MTTDNYKLQVSIKAQNGDLINVRANTADELSVLLEGLTDYSHQIAATSKAVAAAYTVLPLATGSSTPEQQAAPISSTSQMQAASPTCVHGGRKFLSGVSKKNGKPYAMWVCPQPQGADQCSPVNG